MGVGVPWGCGRADDGVRRRRRIERCTADDVQQLRRDRDALADPVAGPERIAQPDAYAEPQQFA